MDLKSTAEQAGRELETASAQDVLRWAVDTFGEKFAIASSMGDGLLAHLAGSVVPGVDVLFLDTGYHFAETIGVAAISRADAATVRAATGYAIGGVAPVGHPAPLRTVVDTWLGRHDVVWAAAGHPHAVFPTTFDELVRITGGTPAQVAP